MRGLLRLSLCCVAAGCSGDTPTTTTSGVPASLVIVSGQSQSAPVATELNSALVVLVKNNAGQPLPGQIVNFRVIRGGGSVFAGAALTNAEGTARERWTLGTSVADSQIVEARAVDAITGDAIVFGRFIATATPGSPASIVLVRGDSQSAHVSKALPESLVVRVQDSYSNPVPGAALSWSIMSGGGTLNGASAATNSAGLGSAAWTLDSVVGPKVARVTVQQTVFAEFNATATSERIFLSVWDGQNQIAVPLTAVFTPPAVMVKDSAGNVMAGQTIRFTVMSGGGTVTGADAVSDSLGIARVGSWTLGPPIGGHSLQATSASGSFVVFWATGSPNAVAVTLDVVAGNNQVVAPSTTVSVVPAVKVIGSGVPTAGVTVTFAVQSGGGSVTGASAVSDAAGIARVGSWTLGDAVGLNTLSAQTASATPVTFTASAVHSTADIALSNVIPDGGVVGDTVAVSVRITSKFQLTSVTARAAGQTTSLTAALGTWTGKLILVGAPRDTATLVIRATDAADAVGEAVRPLIHDRRPRVVMASPLPYSVPRPSAVIDASCEDDDPQGCTLSVKLNGTTIAGPTPSPLLTTLSLIAGLGKESTIQVEARDSRNQSAFASRTVYVENSTHLQLLGTGDGVVADAWDSKLLIRASTANWAIIKPLGNGASDTVSLTGTMQRGFLTPAGAVFTATTSATGSASTVNRLNLWRNGTLTSTVLNSSSLAATGDYAIYTVLPNGTGPLYRVNVVTGDTLRVAATAGNTDNDVAANGGVAYWAGGSVFFYRDGVTTPIAATDGIITNVYPATDGTAVVYQRRFAQQDSTELWLFDGAAYFRLSVVKGTAPRSYYTVNGGWAAFLKPDLGGNLQVWTRSPAGVLRAVSAFGPSSKLAALGTDGTVVFDNGVDRYMAGPTGAAARISSSLGTVVWRSNKFVTLLGNSAFTLVP